MVKINGLEQRACRTVQNEDRSSVKISSLYLNGVKVATMVDERGVEGCENSIQTFVRYPFREDKLRAELARLHPEQPDYGPETLLQELEWLAGLEKEYLRNADKRNGGMLALSLEGGQVTLGIPMRLATATEEEVIASCAPMLERYERIYGTLLGYLIFHTLEDFNRGEALSPEALQ